MELQEQSNDLPIEVTCSGLSSSLVLLVTCPLDKSMNNLLSHIGAQIERKTPPLENWHLNDPPRVSENLCFARHMAICIMAEEVWANNALLFKDKFKRSKFWDHQGSRSTVKKPGKGLNGSRESWQDKDIESIEAVENLGTTKSSIDEISEGSTIKLPEVSFIEFSLTFNSFYSPFRWLGVLADLVELPGFCDPPRVPPDGG